MATVAQHADVVADPHDLLHAVGDVEDRRTLFLQPCDDGEELFGFGLVERRGRLVEDVKARRHFALMGNQRRGDLDEHPVAGAQRAGMAPDVDMVNAERRKRGGRPPAEFRPVDQEPGTDRHLLPEQDVLGHRQLGNDVEFLVDEPEAGCGRVRGRAQRNVVAVLPDGHGVGRHDAREQLDEGRFAGAVFAHEGVNAARLQPQRNVVEHRRRAVALAQPGEFQCRIGGIGQWIAPGVRSRQSVAITAARWPR